MLLEANADDAFQAGLVSLKMLTRKGYHGIILSATRPYVNLLHVCKENNIETEKMLFLDCISRSESESQQETPNVIYLEHISDLTNISISIDRAIEQVSGKRFMFIDSITTMLIHTQEKAFVKFVHSVLTRLRIEEISGILISLTGETNREVRAEIAQLCDRIIQV